MQLNDIEEAIRIVGPMAVHVGLTSEDTRILVEFIDSMYRRGIAGSDAGHLLRHYLKEHKNV